MNQPKAAQNKPIEVTSNNKRQPYGLKDKSKEVLDIIAAEPKTNNTDAYLRVHGTENRLTAASNVHKLLKKETAQIYLDKHIDKARTTVVSLLDSDKDDIRLRSATDILDRTQGKAIQRQQVTTTGVTLSIDLTTSLEEE